MDKSANLSDVADDVISFGNIKQDATTDATGVVELATDAEVESGTSGVIPDAAQIAANYTKSAPVINTTGTSQSVNSITGVESAVLEAELAANRFCRNVIGTQATNLTVTGTGDGRRWDFGENLSTGDVFVLREEIVSNLLTSGIYGINLSDSKYTVTGTSITTETVAGRVLYYSGIYDSTDPYSIIYGYSSSPVGSFIVKLTPVSLTALGAVNAYEKLEIAKVGVSWDYTTYPNWEDVESAVPLEADRLKLWQAFLPDHVSGEYRPQTLRKVVNRGGNLFKIITGEKGYIDLTGGEILGSESVTLYSLLSTNSFVFSSTTDNRGIITEYIAINSATIMAIGFTSTSAISLRIAFYKSDKTFISRSDLIGTITSPDNAAYCKIVFGPTVGSVDTAIEVSNIQLNEGSTANDYTEPLDSPCRFPILGNQVLNNNAQTGTTEGLTAGTTTVSVSSGSFTSAAAGTITSEFTPDESGWWTVWGFNKTADAATYKVGCNSVTGTATAGNGTPKVSVSSSYMEEGTTYTITHTLSAAIAFRFGVFKGVMTAQEVDDLITGDSTQMDYGGTVLHCSDDGTGVWSVDTVAMNSEGEVVLNRAVDVGAGWQLGNDDTLITVATTPSIENLTEQGKATGSLIQSATIGQNHLVCTDKVIVQAVHNTGINGALQAISDSIAGMAYKADITKPQTVTFTLTSGITDGNYEVMPYATINTSFSRFPLYIANATITNVTPPVANLIVTPFENSLLLKAVGGDIAAGTSFSVVVESGDSEVLITIA